MAVRIFHVDLAGGTPEEKAQKVGAFETQVSDFCEMVEDQGWNGACQIAPAGSVLLAILPTMHSNGGHVKKRVVEEAERKWAEKKRSGTAAGPEGKILKP